MRGPRIGGVVALMVFAFSGTAGSYPIPPVTLWKLVDDADAIVVARVRKIDHDARTIDLTSHGRPGETYEEKTSIARLEVVETWKGAPGKDVAVSFSESMVCPAPPQYREGEIAVVFLEASGEKWTTSSLSYGTRYPDAAGLAALRARVSEALALQSSSTAGAKGLLDWLARAAAHPATRWDGLYELASRGDMLHAFADQLRQRSLGVLLSDEQRRIIAAGFVADPRPYQTIPMILDVLATDEDPAVGRTAIAVLEAYSRRPEVPYWVHDAYPRLLARFGDTQIARRTAALGEVFSEIDAAAFRASWNEAKRDLGFPDVEPATLDALNDIVGGYSDHD